ncbi:AAA family ATPase [Pseudomonadales bacterium]|nr:AAA family ATPase [Pseudomonadales bacterium]
MIINTLKMQNFMPYKGEVVIDFPTSSAQNMVVFHGENTKGKTSILNAFRWVLYGEAKSRGELLTYKELLNKEADREGIQLLSVTLSFTSGGSNYSLQRICTGMQETPQILMSKDDLPMDVESARREIENIAPIGTQRFFLFDGELLREYEELMNPNSVTAGRIKTAIEDVMGFPSLVNGLAVLEDVEKVLRLEASTEAKSNRAVEQIKNERDETTESLVTHQNEIKRLKKDLESGEKEHANLARAVGQSKDAQEILNEISSAKTAQEALAERITTREKDLREMRADAWRSLIKPELEQLSAKALIIKKKRETIETAMAQKSYELRSAKKIFETNECPTCGQHVDHSPDIVKLTEQLEADLKDLTLEINAVPDESKVLQTAQLFANAADLSTIRLEEHRLNDLRSERVRGAADVSNARERALALGLSDDQDFIKELQTKLRTSIRLEITLGENRDALAELEETVQELKGKEIALSEKILSLGGEGGAHAETALFKCQSVNRIFETAKSHLREQIKDRVEKAAQEAFLEMTSRPDDYSGLRITDSYGLDIIASDGSVVPQRSAGAEQVVALALIDGLNRVGKSPGPVLMDTPFGRLDKSHRGKILSYMPRSARQFIVFVHSGELDEGEKVISELAHRIGKRYKICSSSAYVSHLETLA